MNVASDLGPALAEERQLKLFGDKQMRTFHKLFCFATLLTVLCAIPAMAQIPTQVTFEAPFAFYAGNAQFPAGKYSITQPEDPDDLLLIRSADGSHSVLVEFEPISSITPPEKTEITFKKYGDSEFISNVTVQGEDIAMKVVPSKVEKNAAKNGEARMHALSARRGS